MTKDQIALKIAERLDLRKGQVKEIVQMTLDEILDAIIEEERLELRNFGVFEVRTKKARKGRNPRTGVEVMVPKHKVITFKAGRHVRAKLRVDE